MRPQTAQRLEILKKCRLIFLDVITQRNFRFHYSPDDLVLDVGDVHDMAHGVALGFQAAPDKIGEDEGAEIPDVRKIMHSRPAAIEANMFSLRVARDKFLQRAGQGIKESQRHASSV